MATTWTRRWVVAGLVVVGCLGTAAMLSAGGNKAVKMTVRSSRMTNSGYVRIMVSVEPNAENRTLSIVADSPNFYRSSEFTLDGDEAARTHWVEWQSLPTGDYDVSAVVKGTAGHRGTATQRLKIFGFEHPDLPIALARTAPSVR